MVKVLFVCMGNICRSPTAEGVMRTFVEQAGLNHTIHIDSCGTSAYHIGEKADSRMSHHASQRGYELTSRARQFDETIDFDEFHYIIVMDEQNYSEICRLDSSGKYHHKVRKMTDYCSNAHEGVVPDPYFGGAAGFERVIDIIEDGCQGLLQQLKSDER